MGTNKLVFLEDETGNKVFDRIKINELVAKFYSKLYGDLERELRNRYVLLVNIQLLNFYIIRRTNFPRTLN